MRRSTEAAELRRASQSMERVGTRALRKKRKKRRRTRSVLFGESRCLRILVFCCQLSPEWASAASPHQKNIENQRTHIGDMCKRGGGGGGRVESSMVKLFLGRFQLGLACR